MRSATASGNSTAAPASNAVPGAAWLQAVILALALSGCGMLDWSDHPPPHRAASKPRPAASHAPPAAAYVVERGDTLYSIAFRNQLDYHDVANWNGIGRDYAIHPGQRLRLTPPGAAVALPAPPVPRPTLVASAAGTAGGSEPGAAASPGPPPASSDIDSAAAVGSWLWPTQGGIVARFDPDGGQKGIDIGGEVGQPVLATAAGKVVYSGSALKGYGELVIVKHNEEYLSAYGYNRRRLVEEGQMVKAGQPIAELGIGPEQKPVLHFEIRDKGRPVDPQGLLPRR